MITDEKEAWAAEIADHVKKQFRHRRAQSNTCLTHALSAGCIGTCGSTAFWWTSRWLRTEIRAESNLRGLLGRFIEEMHWIEDHWRTLQDQLGFI